MTYRQTLEYLYAQLPMFSRIGEKAVKKDLFNTIQLCSLLDNPHHKFPSIHIAGTNGKGSVAHGLASIFQEAGFKTGLYTSPHLKDFRERIKINGQPCPEEFVILFTEKMKPHIENIKPSFFEVTVAMAFEYFAEQNVDMAIIETGLGGRLDSTNVITPQLSVITNISLDHQNILGNTIAEIAFEKAGIIKKEIPVVVGRKSEETNTVFVNKSLQEKAPLYFAEDKVQIGKFSIDRNYLRLNYQLEGDDQTIHSDLRSIYQVENIRTILAAVWAYNQFNPKKISFPEIRNGLERVIPSTCFNGRWQILQENPRVIADVGHNEDGIRKMLAQLRYEDFDQLHIIYGAVKDKDITKILELLPKTARYYFTEPPLPRKLEVEELMQQAETYGLNGDTYLYPKIALESAIRQAKNNDLVLISGSFFVVAEVI